MEILETAIERAGGVGKLAAALGLRQNVVSMWRARNRLPPAWSMVLSDRYGSKAKRPKATQQQAA